MILRIILGIRRIHILLSPDYFKNVTIVSGFSGTGKYSWHGEISGLAIFNHILSDKLLQKLKQPYLLFLNITELLVDTKPSAILTFEKSDINHVIADKPGEVGILLYHILLKYSGISF